MSRLTKWDNHNEQWLENHDNDTRRWVNGSRECMNKLAAYEDTGLTPEQVEHYVITLKNNYYNDINDLLVANMKLAKERDEAIRAVETICIEGLHQNCDLCMQYCDCTDNGGGCCPKYKGCPGHRVENNEEG